VDAAGTCGTNVFLFDDTGTIHREFLPDTEPLKIVRILPAGPKALAQLESSRNVTHS
jgi:hypothetical protein